MIKSDLEKKKQKKKQKLNIQSSPELYAQDPRTRGGAHSKKNKYKIKKKHIHLGHNKKLFWFRLQARHGKGSVSQLNLFLWSFSYSVGMRKCEHVHVYSRKIRQ